MGHILPCFSVGAPVTEKYSGNLLSLPPSERVPLRLWLNMPHPRLLRLCEATELNWTKMSGCTKWSSVYFTAVHFAKCTWKRKLSSVQFSLFLSFCTPIYSTNSCINTISCRSN